jgi:hypothetical protein
MAWANHAGSLKAVGEIATRISADGHISGAGGTSRYAVNGSVRGLSAIAEDLQRFDAIRATFFSVRATLFAPRNAPTIG